MLAVSSTTARPSFGSGWRIHLWTVERGILVMSAI